MLQSKTRWNLKQSNQQAVDILTKELQITPLVAQLLVNRGINTIDSVKERLPDI